MSRPRELGLGEASFLVSARKAWKAVRRPPSRYHAPPQKICFGFQSF